MEQRDLGLCPVPQAVLHPNPALCPNLTCIPWVILHWRSPPQGAGKARSAAPPQGAAEAWWQLTRAVQAASPGLSFPTHQRRL